jgi:hypothetical protein
MLTAAAGTIQSTLDVPGNFGLVMVAISGFQPLPVA